MKKQENEKGAKRSLITLIASTYDHFVDSNDQAIDLSGRFGHSKLSCRHWKVESFRQIYLIHIMPARPVDVTLWRKIRPGRKKIVVKRFGLEPDIVVLEESSEGSEDAVVDDVGRVWPRACRWPWWPGWRRSWRGRRKGVRKFASHRSSLAIWIDSLASFELRGRAESK